MKTNYTLYSNPDISLQEIDISAWECVTSPLEADVILTFPHASYKTHPLSLTIYLDADPDLYEFTAQSNDTAGISSCLDTFKAMLKRLSGLPNKTIVQATQDPYVHATVFAWMRNNHLSLRLSPKLTKGYGYWLNENSGISTETLLDSLALSGYFKGELVDIAYPCPDCQSIQVLLRDCCPGCHHIDIRMEPIVHHFMCGYQSSESSFLNTAGYYTCPKCRGQLKHFGMDYDKPGTISVCQQCFKNTVETEVRGRCINCSTEFEISDAHRKRLLSYQLTDAGVFALFQSDFGIYTAQHLIATHLQLAPPEHLMVLAKKMAAIERRHAFKTLMMECSLNSGNLPLGSADHIRLLTELGKELAQIVRQTDTVTYHLGQFSLLLPGSDQNAGSKVIERLTTSLNRTFTQEILNSLQFHYYPVTDRFAEEEDIA